MWNTVYSGDFKAVVDKLLPILLTTTTGLLYLSFYLLLFSTFFQSQTKELHQQLNTFRFLVYLFVSPINVMQGLYFFDYTYPASIRLFMVSISSFFLLGVVLAQLHAINTIARICILSIGSLVFLPFLFFCFWLYYQTRTRLPLFGSIMITCVSFQRFFVLALGVSFANVLPWWIDQIIGATIDVSLFAYFSFVYSGLLWYIVENDNEDLDDCDPMWTLESARPYVFK